MRPELAAIRRNGPGRPSTMARPRGGDWESRVPISPGSGISVLVSPLTAGETAGSGSPARRNSPGRRA